MGVTSRRTGSLRLRALEAEAVVDGASSKSAKPLAGYFCTPRDLRVGKAKQGRVTGARDHA